MAFKDPKKAREYTANYQKETYARIVVRIRKDTEEWDAIEEYVAHTGNTAATYAHTALLEKLQKDGYLAAKSENG